MKNILALTLIFLTGATFAQQNLQSYTPSILFDQGEWEFKTFQNYYWQSKSFGPNGKVDIGATETWLTNINQYLYGVNKQINLGFDVWTKAAWNTIDSVDSRFAVIGVGPKIKIAPVKSLPRLSIQSTYLLPIGDKLEGTFGEVVFLEEDKQLWLTQFFYDYQINEAFQLFFQQAFWMNFPGQSFRKNSYLKTQTSVFASYFPNPKWTIYAMTEYFPTHYDFNSQSFDAFNTYFVQSGIGLKYQLVPNVIELEALYTDFWLGSDGQGAGQTLNLGVRVINQ